MAAFVLIVGVRRSRAIALAREAAAWLVARGHKVRLLKDDAEATGLHEYASGPDEIAQGAAFAVSLGGDGTMLRAVDLVARAGAPVLGVNLGRLGYLTQVEPHGLVPALERLLAGEYDVEERSMLAVTVEADQPGHYLALNEAVLEKPSPGHTVHLSVSIAGQFFTSYVADGLIVATPTGSTAYAFSARGPIISPRHEGVLLTPVAAHMPFDRSIFLHPSEDVRVEVLDGRGAMLTVDGRELGRLGLGHAVACSVADTRARFVVFGPRDFYGVLKAKFGLADR